LKNNEPEWHSGAFKQISTKRNSNTDAFHELERRSGAFRCISSTGQIAE